MFLVVPVVIFYPISVPPEAGSRIFKGNRTPKAQVVLRNELFRPILATLAEEIQKMLENIRVLAAARLSSSNFHLLRSKQDRKDDREAEKLRRHGCIGLHMLHHFFWGRSVDKLYHVDALLKMWYW